MQFNKPHLSQFQSAISVFCKQVSNENLKEKIITSMATIVKENKLEQSCFEFFMIPSQTASNENHVEKEQENVTIRINGIEHKTSSKCSKVYPRCATVSARLRIEHRRMKEKSDVEIE